MKCLNCDRDLVQLPKKREKVFCDSTCRSNYWQKAKRLEAAGKSPEEIIKTIKKIAVNNKPENKKKIEDERNTAHDLGKKHENSQPLSENELQIAEYEKELSGLGTSGLAVMRRKFLLKQIKALTV